MALANLSLKEDYWETFYLQEADIEFLYNHLLEIETPLSPQKLTNELIKDRLGRELESAERQQNSEGQIYLPKKQFAVGDEIVLPNRDWNVAKVTGLREARTYTEEPFSVIEVEFHDESKREFASELLNHKLNIPPEIHEDDPILSHPAILRTYGDSISKKLVDVLEDNDDFVYIAGSWFPRALIVDVSAGNLNLAEAVLDLKKGGPLQTPEILSQVELPSGINEKLAKFSLDLALQNDQRFDEVGLAGEVAWYLKRLEPPDVLETPLYLRYSPIDYDRSNLTDQMIKLENALDDELSPSYEEDDFDADNLSVNLIFPHWRIGSLPLSPRLAQFFPTAYESPRVRFIIVDGDTGEKFPGWVVRLEKYVFGLREWYLEKGLMPGGKVQLRRGDKPGEVIVQTESHRSTKEWLRTALVGADGGVVYATLKQTIATAFDDRMIVAMPTDTAALDQAWKQREANPLPFEQVIVDTLRELAKLNSQAHVHAEELYSAVNVVYRCPPGPIMALLISRPWFVHVGDLHFRYDEVETE